MKILISFLAYFLFFSTHSGVKDFDKAKQETVQDNKITLLSFSGSDWCAPCIKMKKEFFESEVFSKYAKEHLVLINADFPRLKKNQLSKEQIKKNEELAEKYNKEGKFPFTVLLDSKGNVLKQWEGLPHESPEAFVEEIKMIYNVRI